MADSDNKPDHGGSEPEETGPGDLGGISKADGSGGDGEPVTEAEEPGRTANPEITDNTSATSRGPADAPAAEQAEDSADKSTETPLPPADLELEEEAPILIKRVFGAYVRNLWALLLVAGLPAAPVVLLAQIPVVWPAQEGIYTNGVLETATAPLGTPILAMMVALTVLGLLIAPLSLGGSVLLGGGALLGRRISVTAAWRGALSRYLTVLTWTVTMLVLVGAALALALWLIFRDWPLFWVGAVILPPLLLLLVPLSVMLPVTLLEGHGPFRGLATAWQMGRYRRWPHLVFVTASYGISVLAGTVLERSLLRWTEMAEDGAVLAGITAAVSTLVAPLSLLLLCAPALYAGADSSYASAGSSLYLEIHGVRHWKADESTALPPLRAPIDSTHDLDLGRVGAHLPEPRSEAPRARARPLVTVPLVIAALFVPPLVGPGLVAANPFGLTEFTATPVETERDDDLVVDVSAGDAGVLIGTARRDAQLEWCAPDCTVELDSGFGKGGSGVSAEYGGGLLRTVWREYEHEEETDASRYDPHPDSGLYLTACEDALECGDSDGEVFLRPFDGKLYDLSSAVAPLADGGVVVASHVHHDEERDPDDVVAGDRGGLRLHVCGDAACADPRIMDLPPEVTAGGSLVDGAFMDAAASPEGGFTITAMDPNYGALTVLACESAECAEPEVTEIFGDQFRNEHEDRLRARFGARVEYRSEGTPVLAYRDVRTGEAQLVDCHDALCSEFTENTVAGPGWSRPMPGLAIDSQDRPQLLTPDMAEEELVLLSCLDQGCTQTESTALVGFEEEPAVTALDLDGQDRPHLVWGTGSPDTFSMTHNSESVYLKCEDLYCGAEPATP